MLERFWFAMQFLTRLPVPAGRPMPDAQGEGEAVLYYPLVGLVIGGVLWLLQLLLQGGDPQLVAALLLLVWVAITGALHLDGLGDLADAWIGGQGERQRTLEIMQDPRSGPAAIAALVVLLLVKFAALTTLLEAEASLALLLAPLIGRALLVAALRFLPYARADGMGALAASHLPADRAERVLAAVALVPLLLFGWSGLFLVVVVVLLFLLLRTLLLERLGGITGDAAGALCELGEAATLVVLALIL